MVTGQEGNTGTVRKSSCWQVVLLCGDRSGGKHGDSQKGWFCYVMTGQKGNAGKGEG